MKKRLSIGSLASHGVPLEISPGTLIYKPLQSLNQLANRFQFIDDCEQIEFHIPFTGIGYALTENSWLFDIAAIFGCYRLAHINQLEYLEDSGLDVTNMSLTPGFSHSRYRHSSNVFVLASAITCVNKVWFSKNSGARKALEVAALTHDALTPAGGDTTKAIDRAGFDEDAQYHTLMTAERRGFLCRHGVDPELCIKTVEGKGVLGTLLDIADKLAYVGHDLQAFTMTGMTSSWGLLRDGLIHAYFKKDPLPCKLWEQVRISDDKVWFTDPETLVRFLVIRAKLFRYLYTHPRARYREALVMYCTLLFLYKTKRLSKKTLLSMDDGELRMFLEKNLGWKNNHLLPSVKGFKPTHVGFDSLTKANAFAQKLRDESQVFVRVEDLRKVFKPATHFNVQRNGHIGPLQDLYPKLAQRVVEAGQTIDPIRVSYLEGEEPNLGPLTSEFRAWTKAQTT